MKKEIDQGSMIPPFYGMAYYRYESDKKVCYPIGINLIVILWRDFIYWLKFPKMGK